VGLWPQWIFALLLVLVSFAAGSLCHALTNAISKRINPELYVWREAFLRALGAPVHGIFWIIALALLNQYLIPTDLYPLLDKTLPSVIDVLIILMGTWFLVRLIKRVQTNYTIRAQRRDNELDPTAAGAIAKLACVLVFIITALAIMQVLGVSIGGLLAFGVHSGYCCRFCGTNPSIQFIWRPDGVRESNFPCWRRHYHSWHSVGRHRAEHRLAFHTRARLGR